jgi:hypothetical protein
MDSFSETKSIPSELNSSNARTSVASSSGRITPTSLRTLAVARTIEMKENQHYVPQFYLKGFLDPLQVAKNQHTLWCYSIGRRPKAFPTSRVGCKELFYAYEKDGKLDLSLEDILGKMESLIAPTLRKLASGSISLTVQERAEFSTFLALMLCRSERSFDLSDRITIDITNRQVDNWIKGMDEEKFAAWLANFEKETGRTYDTSFERLKEFQRRIATGEYKSEQTNRGYTIKKMAESVQKMSPKFEEMTWIICKASGDEMFITTDNPVLMDDPHRKTTGSGTENSPLFTFSFPVSREYFIQGQNERGPDGRKYPDQKKAMRNAEVRQVNRMMICGSYKFLYAPFKSERLQELMEHIYKIRPPAIPPVPEEILAILN